MEEAYINGYKSGRRMTREEIHRLRRFYTRLAVLLAVSVIVLIVSVVVVAKPEPVVIEIEIVEQPEVEQPDEAEKVAEAVIGTIGTEREKECFGYNATYVMQVITAECGHDEELCKAVCQAIKNTSRKYGKYTPEEICKLYRYAEPSNFITDEARNSFVSAFVYGEVYSAIEDATLFYNPLYGVSKYHESNEFVTEVNGVRFYREAV